MKYIFLALVALFTVFVAWHVVTLPRVTDIERFVPAGSVQIYDRYDKFVCAVENGESREPVKLSAIPKHVRQALLAIEDRHFYEHEGVNVMSIGRAVLANVRAGKVVEGGSTVTQQLAKNLFLDGQDRSLGRKIKEAALAIQLEQNYSKDQILELYLNQVYFGRNAYGIKRAARAYFNKDVSKLNLGESAFLAGLVKAPSTLGAKSNLPDALARQREVLAAMVETGNITAAQAAAAGKQKLRFQRGTIAVQQHPYFVSYPLGAVRPEFGKTIDSEGLRIYTSMDPLAQTAAEKALNSGISKAPAGVTQGALVSISVADGGVLALVGGVGDYYKAQFNRAVAPHTMGSAFKPFVYLSAFEHSIVTPNTQVMDEPVSVKLPDGQVYTPKNFDNRYMGQLQVRQALAYSRNTVAVRLAEATGVGRVVETARNCGLNAQLDPHLSLALGASAATPLDLAGAYGTFARGGRVIEPWLIRRVETGGGSVLKSFQTPTWNGIAPGAITQLLNCMQDAVRYGTAQLAKLGDRPMAAKTGTSDQAKDLWFVGTTPDIVTAVWGGNDDNQAIPGQATGGTVMSFIWKDYMTKYYAARPTPNGAFPGVGPLDFLFNRGDAKPSAPTGEQLTAAELAPALVAPATEENQATEEVDPAQVPQTPSRTTIDEYGRPVGAPQPAPSFHPENTAGDASQEMAAPQSATPYAAPTAAPAATPAPAYETAPESPGSPATPIGMPSTSGAPVPSGANSGSSADDF